MFKTATDRPRAQPEDAEPCDAVGGLVIYGPTPVRWEDVPPEFPEYLIIGYGAVDRPGVRLGFRVLRGDDPLPDRSDTDAYFEADGQAREVLYEVYSRP